ncbi:CarD family transcriptional regulator [Entomospira culicis]
MDNVVKFKVGQNIVYPLQGVGRVDAIEERQFNGSASTYYTIYLHSFDMTVFVPVEKAPELGLRPIVSKKKAKEALAIVAKDNEPMKGDWKARYQINRDLLKQGSVVDIATVVRALYHRSKVKELPVQERKLFDDALRLLVDEISAALEQSTKEVERLIFGQLEPISGSIDVLYDEDDE